MGASCILTDALLPDGRRVDVTVVDGVVAAVDEVSSSAARSPADLQDRDEEQFLRHDLGGMLLLEGLAEPHAHLDKALSADVVVNATGDLIGAIEAWHEHRGRISSENTLARALRATEIAAEHGVTAIRSHVDVGADIGARGVEALVEARRLCRRLVDLQLVALVGVPLTGAEGAGNRRALAAALAAGADLVGGAPALDPRPAECVAVCLDAAAEAGLAVDLHVDETLDPDVRTLADLARGILDRGFAHPVTASHCVSLGMMPDADQREIATLVAEAGVGVVTLPQTNLFLQGRGRRTAPPRGLTALAALAEAGVRVAGGGDNLQDPFNLMGRGDPFETASLLVTAGHLLPDAALAQVSGRARDVMGLPAAGARPGAVADFVAVAAGSARQAIAAAPGTRLTFKAGRLVARVRRTGAVVSGTATLPPESD
ncbi:MAG: amidohydrolase family protein [bacterium]|nr:amidohydrolase family protein [bacterium]